MKRPMMLAALAVTVLHAGAALGQIPARAFVTTTNFVDAAATAIDLLPAPVPSSVQPGFAGSSTDAVAVASGGRLFVLHRAFSGAQRNTIDVVDPATGVVSQAFSLQDPTPFSTAPNLQDAELFGDDLFVSLYQDPDGLAVCSLSAGTCADRIDVCGALDGADGSCEASAMEKGGGLLLVLVQALDWFTATRPGALVVVDPAARSVVKTIDLLYWNPVDLDALPEGRVVVVSTGSFSTGPTTGVELVDVASGTTESLLDGVTAGGHFALVAASPLHAFVAVAKAPAEKSTCFFSDYEVLTVALLPRPILEGLSLPTARTVLTGACFLTDLEGDGWGNVLVADNTAGEVVRLEGVTGVEVERIDTGNLPPTSIAIVGGLGEILEGTELLP